MFMFKTFRNTLPVSLSDFKQSICNCEINIYDIETLISNQHISK